MMPRPVGFVLGGGASFGAVQVGMLQALAEVEVRPDLVVGTSVGLVSGRVVHLESGQLRPAVLASAAIPGFYPPVRIDGRDLVDGGVVSNVPVDHALRMGARSIVVLDCGVISLRLEPPHSLGETIAQVAAIIMRQQVARDVPEAAREVPVLYLPGPFRLTTSPLDFTASASLMQVAYEKSRAFLAEADPFGPGLYGEAPLITPTDPSEPL
jgi:NTE family protein